MKKLRVVIWLTSAAVIANGCCAVAARAEFAERAARTQRPLRVDGILEAEEWKGATQLDSFVQFAPQRGEPAQEKTEAFVLYDDRYIYFGFRCYDSEPSRITAQLTRRDSELLNDDAVIVILDTFHDSRSGYFFLANALGTQSDGRISENGRVVEYNWDGAWQSAASRFAGGWTVEMAIPFSSLRFRPGREQSWGLNVGRTCRRLLETSFWAGPLEERFRLSQYGALEGLNLEAAQRKYEIIPYVLGQFQQGAEARYEAGLDLRYAVTPENIISFTVNPDFATIEADQEVVNLTRFEVGLREKRQFFLEGSEQYRQRIQTFYSRRIADIRFGAKLLGRYGGWQYSALTAQSDPIPISGDARETASANYSVLRLQRDVLKSSTVAVMASNRALARTQRGAIGAEATMFLTKTFGLTAQLARSHGPEQGGRWAFFIRPSRDTATSHVHFRYGHLGDRFGDHVNAIGFIRDDDRREMDSAVTKEVWFRKGALERFEYDSNYNIYWSQKGVLRSWQIDQEATFDLRNRWSAGVAHSNEYKLFEKPFRNHRTEVSLGYNTREWQSVSAQYEFGRNFDANFQLFGGTVRRKLGKQFSVEYELSRLWLDPDPEHAATTIHVIRGVHNFTKDLFVRCFYQTNSAIDRKNLQAVFVWRYKPPFGAFQFAYQRGTAALGQPSSQGNTAFLKFSYVL